MTLTSKLRQNIAGQPIDHGTEQRAPDVSWGWVIAALVAHTGWGIYPVLGRYMQIVSALLVGGMLLGEQLTSLWQFTGALLVLVTITWYLWQQRGG